MGRVGIQDRTVERSTGDIKEHGYCYDVPTPDSTTPLFVKHIAGCSELFPHSVISRNPGRACSPPIGPVPPNICQQPPPLGACMNRPCASRAIRIAHGRVRNQFPLDRDVIRRGHETASNQPVDTIHNTKVNCPTTVDNATHKPRNNWSLESPVRGCLDPAMKRQVLYW